MDSEDRRRYFVIVTVIVEVVQPILRKKLRNEYTRTGYATLQDFLNGQPVLHILYHLRHKGVICCADSVNCLRNRGPLPLTYYQWDLLYAENPGAANHHCHCRFAAKSTQLEDLDISLSSLILLNCFGLSKNDARSVENLRILKNNYLSHNTKGAINEHEYSTIWADITMHVLQLDSTKQDDLIRIERRPLDPDLCRRYNAELLEMHQKLDEIGSSIGDLDDNVREIKIDVAETKKDVVETRIGVAETKIGMADIKTDLQGLRNDVKTGLLEIKKTIFKRKMKHQRSVGTSTELSPLPSTDKTKHYRIGQGIFKLQFKMRKNILSITDLVMMDDGRIVMCLPFKLALLIYDYKLLKRNKIKVSTDPWSITAVNSHIVAFCCLGYPKVVLYDIDSKTTLKSIQVPNHLCWSDITTVNNTIVVVGYKELLILDYLTEQVIQTIPTGVQPCRIHGVGDKVYFTSHGNDLYRYSVSGETLFTITLPESPLDITLLKDGSMYVACEDSSLIHVSSDCRKYKTVDNIRLEKAFFHRLSYNDEQEKLCSASMDGRVFSVYHEQ